MWVSKLYRVVGFVVGVAACIVGATAQPVRPNVYIDNVNGLAEGSASGAPEGMAPITPPAGCSTLGASNTIQSPLHGLGATPTDGSAAVWMNTASGPRWCRITGIPDANTFTVACRATPNIAVAVSCVVGGRLRDPPGTYTISTSRGLCPDFANGWTITVVNTGTTYMETNSLGCPIQNIGSISSDGRNVLRGDDPDNPTPIEVQYDASYVRGISGGIALKIENLDFIRNAAGTAGDPFMVGNGTDNAAVAKNVQVHQTTGTWVEAFSIGGRPGVILNSQFHGPFTSQCIPTGVEHLVINNYFDGCSGTGAAINTVEANVLFNIVDNQGANAAAFSGNVNNGAGGHWMYNTIVDTGGSGINPGANGDSFYTGNLIGTASALSGGCYDGGTNAAVSFGLSGFGSPTDFWLGNAANTCPTARYTGASGGDFSTSAMGAPTDVNAGAQTDPQFQDAGSLNYFPDNSDVKSSTVFPGATYPFLTPALPVSTMTAGAAQRPGGGGVSAYAY